MVWEPSLLSLRPEVGGLGAESAAWGAASPLPACQDFGLLGPGVLNTCHKMVEMLAMGGWGPEATAVSLSVGAFPLLARAPLRVGRLPGCKDVLVRQARPNRQGGVPGGPRAHDSRSPPATSRGRNDIYSSLWPPRVGKSAGAGTQATPLQVPWLSLSPSLPTPPRRRLSGTSREGLGPLRVQTQSPCLPKPWRRCGATFCLAGAPASARLARTLSVSTVPGGPPVSTQRLAPLFSLGAVGSCGDVHPRSPQRLCGPSWSRQGPVKGLPHFSP